MQTSGKIEELVERVLEKARSEASVIEDRAEKSAERELEHAHTREKRTRQVAEDREEKRIRAKRNAELVKISMWERRKLLARESKLIEDLFSQALDDLRSSENKSERRALLLKLSAEAIAALGVSEVSLAFNRDDRKLIRDADLSGLDGDLSISPEPLNSLGGVVASDKSGRLVYENTFEARLERDYERLRSLVAEKLELDEIEVDE